MSSTLCRYRQNPTVISMERDRFAFNTSFPSILICRSTKVNDTFLETFLKNTTHILDKDLYRFIPSLLEATYNNFENIIEYPGIRGEELLGLILKFQFPFQPTVSNSALN